MVEWVGYLASILVAISITINGGIYFRILNMIGSACFFTYGLLIQGWPIVLINVYAIGINVFYIVRMYLAKRRKISQNPIAVSENSDNLLD